MARRHSPAIAAPAIPAYALAEPIDVDQDTNLTITAARSTAIGVHAVAPETGPAQCSVRFRGTDGEVFEIHGDMIDLYHFSNSLAAQIRAEMHRVSR